MLFFTAIMLNVFCSSYIVKADVVISSKKPIVLKSTNFKTKKMLTVPDRSEERRKKEEAKRRASRGNSSASRYSDKPLVAGSGSSVVNYAKKFLGRPYVWGAEGPRSFDCSGFTQYVYKAHGVYLPHYTGYQVKKGSAISKSNLNLGDLIFFNTDGSFSHVGIYIGSGKFIHASSGSRKVTISSLNGSYYRSRYAGARRIFK